MIKNFSVVNVILIISSIFKPTQSKCDTYYLLMEKKINDFGFDQFFPFSTEENPWITTKVNNNTNTFDMKCVLDLKCVSSIGWTPVTHKSTHGLVGSDNRPKYPLPPPYIPIETPNLTTTSVGPLETTEYSTITTEEIITTALDVIQTLHDENTEKTKATTTIDDIKNDEDKTNATAGLQVKEPERNSKDLAVTIVAATGGVIAAGVVAFLAKYLITKYLQSGVYRIPDP